MLYVITIFVLSYIAAIPESVTTTTADKTSEHAKCMLYYTGHLFFLGIVKASVTQSSPQIITTSVTPNSTDKTPIASTGLSDTLLVY